MKNLARAVINAAAFLEFSDDDTIDPDDAVRALEDLASFLLPASPDEIAAIRSVLEEELDAANQRGASEEVLDFYRNFLKHCGIDE